MPGVWAGVATSEPALGSVDIAEEKCADVPQFLSQEVNNIWVIPFRKKSIAGMSSSFEGFLKLAIKLFHVASSSQKILEVSKHVNSKNSWEAQQMIAHYHS